MSDSKPRLWSGNFARFVHSQVVVVLYLRQFDALLKSGLQSFEQLNDGREVCNHENWARLNITCNYSIVEIIGFLLKKG